jgi:polyisoprenoid-binding protein YceI
MVLTHEYLVKRAELGVLTNSSWNKFCMLKFKKQIMRKNIQLIPQVLTLVSVLAFTSCNNAPKGDEATITDQQKAAEPTGQTFVVDTADSKVKFEGYGVGKKHPGKFRVSSGNVSVSNNQITGGEFVINIRSLDLEEKGDMYDNKLKPHLLSGDFFDAEKFNTAKFEITKVEPYERNDKDTSIVDGANFNVSGNFTLKGETKNITFPARIDLDDNTLKGKADFDINRTEWKMNYGNDKTLGDKFISEKVNIELDLKANRQ